MRAGMSGLDFVGGGRRSLPLLPPLGQAAAFLASEDAMHLGVLEVILPCPSFFPGVVVVAEVCIVGPVGRDPSPGTITYAMYS